MSDVVDGEQLKLDLGAETVAAEPYNDQELMVALEKDPRMGATFSQLCGVCERATSLLQYVLHMNKGYAQLTPTILCMDKPGDQVAIKKGEDGSFILSLRNADGLNVYSQISGKLADGPRPAYVQASQVIEAKEATVESPKS